MRFAIIENGYVINVIEYDEQPINPPPGFNEGAIAVQSDEAQIGWGYVSGQFVPPPPVPLPAIPVDEARKTAYQTEADPLFFKWQAGEGTEEAWLAKREEIRQRYPAVKVQVGYPESTVDLLLNATSLGLNATDPLPLDESRLALSMTTAVYDMIYRPAETPLLLRAKAAGRRTANGIGMLL